MKNACIPRNHHRRFVCLLGLLLLMIMTRYAFQIDLPRLAFLGMIGLIALLGDQDEITAMIIACIPLHESIDFFYALVLCTVVYVCKFYRQIRLGTNVLLVLVIILWELLHCLRSSFSPVEFLSCVIPFIILAVLMASDVEKIDYGFVARVFAWVTLGVSMVLLVRVLYLSNFNMIRAIAGLRRLGLDTHTGVGNAKISGNQINPNTLGIVTVLASTGLMQIRRMGGSRKLDLVLMCTMIVLAALSTSRTYLACLLLMVVLLVLSERGGFGKKAKAMAGISVMVAVAVVIFALIFPSNFEYFVGRFTVRDITTGRNGLMVQYHNFIVENPIVLLFGIGYQSFGYRLLEIYRVAEVVPHNSIQELIIVWGVVGLLLFAALFVSMFYNSRCCNRKQSLLNCIPLIIILFKGMAGQMLNSPYTMLAFSFAYLSLCADMSKSNIHCGEVM